MNFGDVKPSRLSSDVALLKTEFDAAARSSRNLGQEAKTAFSGIRVEGNRAVGDSKELGRVLAGVFGDVVAGGKSLQDILRSVAGDLAKLAVQDIFGNAGGSGGSGGFDLGGLLGGLVSANAAGNVIQGGRVQAFAKGGVLSSPSLFPMSRGVGLAGEAGPEAILPLSRGSDGKLGVATQGGVRPISVTFNVTATDAASFRRSETQIAAMLNRTVSRGARNL